MARLYRPLLEPLGLTYPQYLVMLSLWDRDGQTVGSLGEAVALESNTLTPLLKRMEATGLLTRSRSKKDERVTEIFLTPKGKALREDAQGVHACIVEATGLDPSQLTALRDEVLALETKIAKAVARR